MTYTILLGVSTVNIRSHLRLSSENRGVVIITRVVIIIHGLFVRAASTLSTDEYQPRLYFEMKVGAFRFVLLLPFATCN